MTCLFNNVGISCYYSICTTTNNPVKEQFPIVRHNIHFQPQSFSHPRQEHFPTEAFLWIKTKSQKNFFSILTVVSYEFGMLTSNNGMGFALSHLVSEVRHSLVGEQFKQLPHEKAYATRLSQGSCVNHSLMRLHYINKTRHD